MESPQSSSRTLGEHPEEVSGQEHTNEPNLRSEECHGNGQGNGTVKDSSNPSSNGAANDPLLKRGKKFLNKTFSRGDMKKHNEEVTDSSDAADNPPNGSAGSQDSSDANGAMITNDHVYDVTGANGGNNKSSNGRRGFRAKLTGLGRNITNIIHRGRNNSNNSSNTQAQPMPHPNATSTVALNSENSSTATQPAAQKSHIQATTEAKGLSATAGNIVSNTPTQSAASKPVTPTAGQAKGNPTTTADGPVIGPPTPGLDGAGPAGWEQVLH